MIHKHRKEARKGNPKYKRMEAHIPKELSVAFREYLVREDKTINEGVEEAIRLYLSQKNTEEENQED